MGVNVYPKQLGAGSRACVAFRTTVKLARQTYHNATPLSQPLAHKADRGDAQGAALVKQASPVAWQPINFYGRYEFRKPPEVGECGRNRSGVGGNPNRDPRPLWHREPGWNLFVGLCNNPQQRLSYLAGELARLKADSPLRRFLRGALAAYRRFLFTADPAHRFHCWATLQAVSVGLDQIEHRGDRPEVAGSAPDGPDPGRSLAAGRADQVH